MKNKAIKIGIFASVLPHVFCCGMPIALSLVGLFVPEGAHFSLIPEWLEPWVFVFSAGMLGVSWVLVGRECGCACNGCHGAHAHHIQKTILAIITVIFVISVILHIVAHG